MKKWTMAATAALFLILLAALMIPGGQFTPENVPGDNGQDRSEVVEDNNGRQEAVPEATQESGRDNGYGVYPGDRAYEFQLNDLEGNRVKLSDYRDRVVFISFWQTTSSWCVDQLPLLDELYKTYKDGDAMVIAVNIAEDSERVEEAVYNNNFMFPVLLDTQAEVAKKYSISSIPTNYIINPEGYISDMHIGYMEYQLMEKYIEAAFRD